MVLPLIHRIMKLQSKKILKGKYRFNVYKAGTKELIKQTDWIKNLVVLGDGYGANIVIKNLLGDLTYDLEITSASVGTGDTAPADSDTDLETPILENIQIATREETADDEATFHFFMNDGQLPDNTYKEFGIFCGTQLFARSLITPTYTKTSGQDIDCEYVITIANS